MARCSGLVFSLTIACSVLMESLNAAAATPDPRSCPPERREFCLILALSRIANVQVADETLRPGERSSRIHGTEGSIVQRSNDDDVDDDDDDESGRGRSVHCRATRDVYVPDAGQTLPAFLCSVDGTTFLLSSPRFLQDRKRPPYLDVNLERTAIHGVREASARMPPWRRSNDAELFDVVPALLVLRNGENGYRVRARNPGPSGRSWRRRTRRNPEVVG